MVRSALLSAHRQAYGGKPLFCDPCVPSSSAQIFERLPRDAFEHDHLTLELGPNEGISVSFLAKVPGPTIKLGPAHMSFRYEGSFGSALIEAYERLIHDALIGDRTLFTRGDGIERTWQVVGDVIADPPQLKRYTPGSWGPNEADKLIAPRRWHFPASHQHAHGP